MMTVMMMTTHIHLHLQLATNLACILETDNALVYCRNSRSRSQAVLVIFYLVFRDGLGVELEQLLAQKRPPDAWRTIERTRVW